MKLTYFYNRLLLILMVFMFFPSVLGGGEVTIIDNHTLRMEVDDEIRTVTNHTIIWDEETNSTPIYMIETDDEVGIEIYARNNKFHEIKIIEGIKNKWYPVYLCMNYPLENYIWNQENSSFCENYKYSFRLRNMKEGQNRAFEIPPIINGENKWSIWVDSGASGGGGLPICSGLGSGIKLNQTQAIVNTSVVKMEGVGFYNSYPAGCTAIQLYWQEHDGSIWRTLNSYDMPNLNTKCLSGGNPCIQTPITFSVWYAKNVMCNKEGNSSMAILFKGTYNSRVIYTRSATKNLECLPMIIEEDNKLTDDLIILNKLKSNERRSKDFYWLLLLPIPIFLMKKRNNK